MSLVGALWSWGTFAAAGLGAALVLISAPLRAALGGGDDDARAWTLALGGAWALLTVVGSAASSLSGKGRELAPLERFAALVSTLLLLGVLGVLGRVVLYFAPTGSETAAAKLLDRAFDPAWSALGAVASRIGAPPDLAGVPTGPLILFALLLLGRNWVTWRIDKLRRRVYRQEVPLPTDTRSHRQHSQEGPGWADAVERPAVAPSGGSRDAPLVSPDGADVRLPRHRRDAAPRAG
jgi:hypothetical protein